MNKKNYQQDPAIFDSGDFLQKANSTVPAKPREHIIPDLNATNSWWLELYAECDMHFK